MDESDVEQPMLPQESSANIVCTEVDFRFVGGCLSLALDMC